MKNILIDIDTNGENAHKFAQNVELYDIITPHVLFLVDNTGEVFISAEIDWIKTRPYFQPDNNGHCIYFKDDSYIAAYEFTKIGVSVLDEFYIKTLSELCNELAKLYNIKSWQYFK